ncbi:MAG: M23 family metallopeptidase, partial [Rudaea sp.]
IVNKPVRGIIATMFPSFRLFILALFLLAGEPLTGASQAVAGSMPRSDSGRTDVSLPAPGERPFSLPFAGPPGPTTWLMAQGYGNTVGAYQQRSQWYGAGQGLHFGIDLSAPCGTTILAIGDGVVLGTDGPWGSAPHNLMIDHGNGLMSMYGHLLERANLKAGQVVKKGEPVAKSGDPDGTCYSRPHLHLEIRSRASNRFYNPIQFIDADWDTIALTGSFSRGFERDLDNPRRWQNLYDQPDAIPGGPFLNNYLHPWPPAPITR